MAAAVTRELSIKYGSVETGAATDYLIDGHPILTYGPLSANVTWRVLVTGTSEANFQSNLDMLESAFVLRFQRLIWKYGSTTFQDFNPTDNSGFNQDPSLTKSGEDADTARSRIVILSVDMDLPADDNAGRIESSVSIAYDRSDIRTVTVTGIYTAQDGFTALANYEAKGPAYAASLLPSGTFELLTQDVGHDDQNKIANWTRVYREIKYGQSSAGLDHASVVDHFVSFSRTTVGPGDTVGGGLGEARRLHSATASYTCNVDSGATTNLKSLWKNTLRPYVLNQAKSIFGASRIAIDAENPTYSKAHNTINASLSLSMIITGSAVFEYEASQTIDKQPGLFAVPAWDGNPYAKYIYEGPASTTRTTVRRYKVNSQLALQRVKGAGSLATGDTGGDGRWSGDKSKTGWIRQTEPVQTTPRTIGIPGLGDRIPVTEVVETFVDFWVEAPSAGGGVATGASASGSANSSGGSLSPGPEESGTSPRDANFGPVGGLNPIDLPFTPRN